MDLCLCAYVDAAGRLVYDQDIRIGQQPAAYKDLLLVAARQVLDRGVDRRRFCIQLLYIFLGVLAHLFMIERETVFFQVCQHRVVFYAQQADDTVAAAVLGQQADLVGDRVLRGLDMQLLAVLEDLAAGYRAHAENGLCCFGTSCAYQSGHAQNLAAVQFERDILYSASGRQVFNFQNSVSNRAVHLGEHRCYLAAYHQLDHLIDVQILRTVGRDVLAVAIDGDIVRDAENFVHLMGNIDDCYVFRLQLRDDVAQVLYPSVGQGRSRFVHDDDAAVIGNRLGDLHHLHLCNREVAHLLIRIDIQIEFLEQLNAVVAHFLMIDDQALAGCAPQPKVFTDASLRNRRKLLMDHGNTRVERFQCILKTDLFAFKDDLARGRRMDTDQAFHQRRLARAVLAHQGVDGTRAHLELHALECTHERDILKCPFPNAVVCFIRSLRHSPQ